MHLLNQLLAKIPKKSWFVTALLLRLVVAPFLSHPFDMRVFMAVGVAVSKGVTPYGQYVLQDIFAATPHLHLYGNFLGIGYPPLWGLIAGGMRGISSLFAPNSLYSYVLALKIPIILGELALAVTVYNILKRQLNIRVATATYLLFLFCPFIVAVGTIWGMFDVIALLFALLSAFYLNTNWKTSSIFLAISSTLKVFPIILAPLYAILLHKSGKGIKAVAGFIVSASTLTASMVFLPMFAFNWPISNLYNALTYHVTATTPYYDGMASFPYGAASPFNAFSLVNAIFGRNVQPPSFLLYAWILACVGVYALLIRARTTITVKVIGVNTNLASTVQWSLLTLLAFFTTRVWVSEQNLIFLFVFFALSVLLQFPRDMGRVELLWILLSVFVIVHVPIVSFFWLPYPWTLNMANAFAEGPLSWTRLLAMTILTFGWLGLCWHYVTNRLRWLK